MERISESSLTEAFEAMTKEGQVRLPTDLVLVPELETPFGVVDFAGVVPAVSLTPRGTELLTQRQVATVLPLLKRAAPRTLRYLSDMVSGPEPSVLRLLDEMTDAGLVARQGTGFLLGPAFALEPPQIWAFELKVEHWGRAIHQVLRYRLFAHAVAVVMPLPWATNANRQRTRFSATGVGLLALDTGRHRARWFVRPAVRRPASPRQYFDSLGRMASRLTEIPPIQDPDG